MQTSPDREARDGFAVVRARIFLSYSTEDSALAERLRKHIERDGVQCFFAPRSIKPLEGWERRLEQEIQGCDLLLLLHTTSSSASEWVQREVLQAERVNREIIEVRMASIKIDPFFQADRSANWKQAFYLNADHEALCFDAVWQAINALRPAGRRLGNVRAENCPYPGARPFPESGFDDVFFGQAGAIGNLTQAITAATPLVMVYGPSGAGKTSLLTIGMRKSLPREYVYSMPINGTTATASDLLRMALARVSGSEGAAATVADATMIEAILDAIRSGPSNHYVLCFDQMETFFAEGAQPNEIRVFLESLQTILARRSKQISFLVSFRKEALADVERHVERYFRPDELKKVFVPKLMLAEAGECIVGPAARRDIAFDGNLAQALLEALAKDDGSGLVPVNPMDIQKVCWRLWNDLVTIPGPPRWRIDANALAAVLTQRSMPDEGLSANARAYIARVLAGFMHAKIAEIADRMPTGTAGNNPKEWVILGLATVFVGPAGERLRVNERRANAKRYVGKLDIEVVKGLVDSGLVQSCGDHQYELAHDSLATEIHLLGSKSKSVFAVKLLDSELARDKQSVLGPAPWESERGSARDQAALARVTFNRHAELLAELEAVRDNRWPFDEDEADFLVRSALGDRRQNIGEKAVNLEEWVSILHQRSPERLLGTLTEALASSNRAVQLDVMNLLQKPEVLDVVKGDSERQAPLEESLQDLALRHTGPVQEKACAALVACGFKRGIARLFECLQGPDKRYEARMGLALARHAVDTIKDPSEGFAEHWKLLNRRSRLIVLSKLYWWRVKQTWGWLLVIMILAAFGTAVGAVLPFIPLGHWGASLTTEEKGIATGMFQGASGGVVWGLTAAGILAYAVVGRGGRLRNSARDKIAMATFGMVAGALGGFVNSAVIALVFHTNGLYESGWLNPSAVGRVHEVLVVTRLGWVTPLFGAALGVGIGWSLTVIIADPAERWIREKAFATFGEFWSAMKTIAGRVMRESWRVALCLAIAAVLVCYLIRPGDGVCNPSAHIDHENKPKHKVVTLNQRAYVVPEGCEPKKWLPATSVRSAGLAFIIFGGSVFQEMAFLLGLLVVQFGVDLKKNLREDRYFLRSAEHQDTG